MPIKGSDSCGFAAVVFSPEHLSIIKDGPSERRDFLDTGIGQLKSRYRGVLGEYLRVMKQRNAFLKMKLSEIEFNTTLDVYDMQLARLGSIIKKTRESYLTQLSPKAQQYFSQMCKGEHCLSLSYDSLVPDSPEEYVKMLLESRDKDIATGSTLLGVHRYDVTVEIDGKAARLYGSQVQQRCCVLALKLAEAYIFGEFLGEHPVVLLDDVLSELDEIRRSFLLEHLVGPQIFITACDPPEEFKKRPLALFTVKDGVITSEGCDDCDNSYDKTEET